MRDDLGAKPAGERGGVALDDEVDVGATAPEQEVAHRAADQVDGLGRDLAHGGELRVDALQRLGEALAGLGRHQRRTGMPSAARRSFASRTRKVP